LAEFFWNADRKVIQMSAETLALPSTPLDLSC
jgi:hypothetical protein